MANEQQPVVMNLSKEVLDGVVKAAVIQALPEQARLRMVEAVVSAALNTKSDRNYGRDTIFEQAIKDALTEEARRQCDEYLNEMRPMMTKRIREEIKRRNFADKIVDELVKSLGVVSFRISIGGE